MPFTAVPREKVKGPVPVPLPLSKAHNRESPELIPPPDVQLVPATTTSPSFGLVPKLVVTVSRLTEFVTVLSVTAVLSPPSCDQDILSLELRAPAVVTKIKLADAGTQIKQAPASRIMAFDFMKVNPPPWAGTSCRSGMRA